jgi:3-hydroxyacyl-CoA dehydrogenase
MPSNKPVRRVAIIGTGVIGASWTALFLAKGLDVVATDIASNAEASLKRLSRPLGRPFRGWASRLARRNRACPSRPTSPRR